jgi:capsular polysaccharide biosynthesis protein/Mrp family chromosome partitioning ATPase
VNPAERSDSYGGDYTSVLRRRWLIVVAGLCVGVIGTFAYLTITPALYLATSAVYVAPNGADHSNQITDARTGVIDLDTEAQIVTSGTVGAAAAHLMHSTQPVSSLVSDIGITVPPNAYVLDISCTSRSGTTAASCANAFAKAYVQYRSSSATAWLEGQIKTLQDTVSGLQKSVVTLKTSISALPANSSTRLTEQAEVSSYNNLLGPLNRQITLLHREAANVTSSRVLTYAPPSTHADTPRRSLVLLSGLAGGLLLGLMGAFVWDRRDKRIRGAKDVERLLDLRVLLNRPNAFRGQVSLMPVRSATGQAFTELAHAVAAALGEGNHVLLVAGASPGPAASATAANLAAALARTQSEAVLVCTDRGSTVSPGILGLGEEQGLAEVMAGSASVREVARDTAAAPGLWVITPGADAALADPVLPRDRVQDLVSQLRHDARYVVIEAQAAEDGTDTFAFAEFADAALVTVETSRTSSTAAGECVQRLQQVRTPVIGAAVVSPVRRGVKVRPPQPGQPPGGERRDRARAGRDELLATAAAPLKSQDGDGRTTRRPDSHGGPAEKNWGS